MAKWTAQERKGPLHNYRPNALVPTPEILLRATVLGWIVEMERSYVAVSAFPDLCPSPPSLHLGPPVMPPDRVTKVKKSYHIPAKHAPVTSLLT